MALGRYRFSRLFAQLEQRLNITEMRSPIGNKNLLANWIKNNFQFPCGVSYNIWKMDPKNASFWDPFKIKNLHVIPNDIPPQF